MSNHFKEQRIMKEALRESAVVFDREKHEYRLNGQRISGVTPVIGKAGGEGDDRG